MKHRHFNRGVFLLTFLSGTIFFSCNSNDEPHDSLRDGLLVYYPFSGNAKDKSGNDFHGTNFGATLSNDKDGNPNSSYRFDGVDDYIELGDILDDVTYPFTVSAWVKQETHAGPYNCILSSQDNSPTYNGFDFNVHSPTTFGINTGDGRGENNAAFRRGKSATISDKTNVWTHVCAVVYSSNDMRLYVDGVDVGGTYSGDSDQPMNSNFPDDVARIGRVTSNGITVFFTGYIDELRVWDRALSESEIQRSM